MPKNRTTLTGSEILRALRKQGETLRRYRVRKIGVFGSHVSGKPTRRSDIDLLVEFEQPSFDNFMGLANDLEKLFGRKIDILTPEGVRSIRVKGLAKRIRKNVLYVQTSTS